MGCFAEDIDMASRGWKLWDGMVSKYQDTIETCYCVFFNNDRITLKALELFEVFRKQRLFRKIVIITDIKIIQNLIYINETINIEFFPEYDITCLLKYYTLHKFSNNFYVLSLDKFEQCCLKSVMEGLSLEEVILLGLYKLNSMG